MARPHHFIFNELSRAINRGIQVTPLVDALIECGVIKDADRKRYTGRNGMNYLTGHLRNRDFDTFVRFVECIGKVEKLKPTTVSLVESIFKALQTYDKDHSTSYADKISLQTPTQVEPQIQTQTEVEQIEGTTSLSEESATRFPPAQPEETIPVIPTCVDQMPGILEDSISKATVDSNGQTLSSFDYGYEIIIPTGAVPKENPISFEVGVSTHGPYKLPQAQYRITEFLCVFADGEFQSPVAVSLSHCLELSEYKQTSSIAVMRADMDEVNENGEYIFRQLDIHADISDEFSTLSFKLTNFCVLCAVYNLETTKTRSYERQGSSTDSVDTTAAHLVRQVAIDDPSTESAPPSSPQASVEDRDGPYKVRVGSGSVPPAFKRSTEDEENPHLTSSGELFVPITKVKQKRASKRGTHAPYSPRRPTKASVQYKLMLCEPTYIDERSKTFEVYIYACLDCPGSIQACKKQSKEYKHTPQEFYFESDKIQFHLTVPSPGWAVKPKVSPMKISKQAIQRYRSDGAAAALVEMGDYPPRRVFTVTWTDPSCLPNTVGDVCQVRVVHDGLDSLVCEFNITAPQLLPVSTPAAVPSASIYSSPWQQYSSEAPFNPQLYPQSQGYAGAVPNAFEHQSFAGTLQQPSWSPYNPNTMVTNRAVPTNPTWGPVPGYYPSPVSPMPVLQPVPSSLPTPLNSRSSERLQRSLSNEQKQALSKQVNEEFILKLYKHVMKWKMLGRHLGLDNAKIEQLDSDNKNDSREATYKMLCDWSKMNDGNATYQTLVDALLEAEESQALQYLLDNLPNEQ